MCNLAVVTNDNLKIPVYFDLSEQEFFILENNNKKIVKEALIVKNYLYFYDKTFISYPENTDKIPVTKMSETQLNLYFNKEVKEKGDEFKDFDFKISFNDKNGFTIRDCYEKRGLPISPKQEREINLIKQDINNLLGFYSIIDIKGLKLNTEIILSLIGELSVITPESFLDGYSINGDRNCNLWFNDRIIYTSNEQEYIGFVKNLTKYNICLSLDNGDTKYIDYNKSKSIKKYQDNKLSNNNFDYNIDANVVFAEIKKFKIDDPFCTGKNETIARCIKCVNCNTICKEKSTNYFECVLCSQAVQCLSVEGDIGLFIIGNSPEYYKNEIEEVKCCNNCGLANFGTTAHGSKKALSKCGFSNKIIEPHNYCSKWIPMNHDNKYKEIKRKIIKGKPLIEDKSRGIGEPKPSEIKDLETLRSENVKLKIKDYKEKYNNWLISLKEQAKNKETLKFD